MIPQSKSVLDLFDRGYVSMGELRRELELYERTGEVTPTLERAAEEIERQFHMDRVVRLTSAVDDIDRIVQEMKALAG